jgi:GT2 family glycosyltransferase
MKLTLGVLITYYNEKDLLRDCLDSLLAQSEHPDEVLIYDDVSEIPPEKYVPKNFPVQIIHGDVNRGPAHGRNVLLLASQSEYVHFHDADDLFHPDWCRRVRQKIEETGANLIITEISSYRDNQKICDRVLNLERLVAGEDFLKFCIEGSILTAASTCRRSSALAVRGYRGSVQPVEDFDFHARLAAMGIRYAVITDPLIIQRLRKLSYSTRNWLNAWISLTESIRMLSRELPQKYRQDLAERATVAGSILFKLGARTKAKEAFRLAKELGPPVFSGQRRLYRVLARTFGQEVAEEVGVIYRKIFPKKVRRLIAKSGY